MMSNSFPLVATAVTIFVSSADEIPIPIDLGPVERVVSYIGLLAMGWFFWRRESTRSDQTNEDLKAENKILKRDIKELEKDIRALLSNRESKRVMRRHSDLFEELENEDDDSKEEG